MDDKSIIDYAREYPIFGVGALFIILGFFGTSLLGTDLTLVLWLGIFIAIFGLILPRIRR